MLPEVGGCPWRQSPRSGTIETTHRDAAREAIREAHLRDKRVFLTGEDVGTVAVTP
jgi:hypothetical protein